MAPWVRTHGEGEAPTEPGFSSGPRIPWNVIPRWTPSGSAARGFANDGTFSEKNLVAQHSFVHEAS